MSIDILNRYTRAVIYHSETATTIAEAVIEAVKNRASLDGASLVGARLDGAILVGASLVGARLDGARLDGAILDGARLDGAILVGAILDGASLVGASLVGARLDGAILVGAKGINKYITTPLHMLRDQPGKIRAYKLVNSDGEGPFNGGITYRVGEWCEVPEADTDENQPCAAGINLATLDWCMREWRTGYRILIAEFEAADIAAIPIGSDGKFRVFRCIIVGEKDLVEIGLIAAEVAAETGGAK